MKKKLCIYVAHPITGLSYKEIHDYYVDIVKYLEDVGWNVLHPMTAKSFLSNSGDIKATGYQNPAATDHAITERDLWMVRTSDVILVDLFGAKTVSIGCVSELSVGYSLKKHTVTVMEKSNVHDHAFVHQQSHIIYPTLDDAKKYLKKLITNEF